MRTGPPPRLWPRQKERAENLMIVDLLTNDLGRIARLGSVAVPSLFALEPWATVWQMTSTVQRRTRPEVRLRDVFAARSRAGRDRRAEIEAMAAIVEREAGPRGLYCGALVSMPGGEACFNVPIRTLTLDQDQRLASCGIGSGIVADSSAVGEHREWRAKSRPAPGNLGFPLIETLVRRRGRYWLLDAHLGRMGASAQVFGFPWRRDAIRQALDQAVAGFRDGQWRVRRSLDGAGGIELVNPAFQPLPDHCGLRPGPGAGVECGSPLAPQNHPAGALPTGSGPATSTPCSGMSGARPPNSPVAIWWRA